MPCFSSAAIPFHDPSVRRHFLQRFNDAGIAAHQLQPLPYAPSSAEAMADYGRIHLHLDSYPVSGTTTTLGFSGDGYSCAHCPTPYYAGAISAAILEMLAFPTTFAATKHSCQLMLAGWRIATVVVRARRELAQQVRQSPICDAEAMPRMFVEQLVSMLRQKRAA